jgi:SAM-dependent methyltransferase
MLPSFPVSGLEIRSMATNPDSWVYGDYAPNPESRDLVGLKARWILDRLPAGAAPTVLDYGSGEGKHLHLVRKVKPRARLVGVDVRDTHTKVDFEFHRVAGDAALPFDADTFDLVISCDVLEHVESIERSLDEIRRVLRPGGAFIGFVPVEGGPGPHAFFRLFDPNIYRDTKDHINAYRRSELVAWMSSRFRIVKLAYSYHFLGATLDAVFFASFKAPGIGPKVEAFWRGQENVFYRGQASASKPSLIGRFAQLANRTAYSESRLLRDVPFGAKGLHFHVEKS